MGSAHDDALWYGQLARERETKDAATLANRIERQMNDYATHGEGTIFDLSPDEQPLVIKALRALLPSK